MDYVILALIGAVGGAVSVYFPTEAKRRKLAEQQRKQASREAELESQAKAINGRIEEYQQAVGRFKAEREKFDAQVITYREMKDENAILKRDLRNLDVLARKLRLDHETQGQTQTTIDQRVKELGSRYLKENVKWIGVSLNPNNFSACKQRLQDVIERCRGIGFDIPSHEEAELQAQLKIEYEKVVRAAFEREEQARIKIQIREEQIREREIERKRLQLEAEEEAIKAALAKALAIAQNQHSEEVERLRAKLAEAEANKRALSQAQLTKSGNVYVISNIGSFGEGVFKVGMTRRLEPLDRVRELGDASVPFPFDVHMMIKSKDAPSLENALHKRLYKQRINKTNPRKEFFRATVDEIYQVVREHHGEVEYLVDPEALQYRQSLEMSDDDQEFIESVYDDADEESVAIPDEM